MLNNRIFQWFVKKPPFLIPLASTLRPYVLVTHGSKYRWCLRACVKGTNRTFVHDGYFFDFFGALPWSFLFLLRCWHVSSPAWKWCALTPDFIFARSDEKYTPGNAFDSSMYLRNRLFRRPDPGWRKTSASCKGRLPPVVEAMLQRERFELQKWLSHEPGQRLRELHSELNSSQFKSEKSTVVLHIQRQDF